MKIKREGQELNVKSMNFTVKEIGVPEDRTLRFIGSDATPDRDGDIIMPEGWDLKNYNMNPVFLWAHDYSIPPIGKSIKTWVEKGKLLFDIVFPEKGIYPFADTVYNLYKGGFLNATSVGFVGKQAEQRDDEAVKELPEWRRGVKFLEQELLELSAVPVPSNPAAIQQAKSAGAVTDDEYTSLMSFINGDFINNPHAGAKTLKGIQNVYEAQTEKTEEKEADDVKDENPETSAENTNEKKFSFMIDPATKTTHLVDLKSGTVLGDITEEVKSLVTNAIEAYKKSDSVEAKSFQPEEKAGAVLSKKNKSRLSQAKDLIIEVLGQVDDESSMEDQKDPAVLEDEEELTNPEDTSMNSGKKSDMDDEEEGKEDDEEQNDEEQDEEDKKKKSADADEFVFELEDNPSDNLIEIDADAIQALVKSAVASIVPSSN